MLVWHAHFHKARSICERCAAFSGVRVRVFASQEDYEASDFADGEDRLHGEPGGASLAVWPGKHNVGRKSDEWWCCIPMHPNCGCGWRKAGPEGEREDWFADIGEAEQ